MSKRGVSANQSVSSAIRADSRVRKELHLTSAQLRYLQTEEGGSVKDWAAPSHSTLLSLIRRGLLETRGGGNIAAGSTRFFYITPAGYQAIDISCRVAKEKS